MKRTYTPSLEEISRKYGEQYFTVSTARIGCAYDSAEQYDTLDGIVSIMDATIFSAYGDAADLDKYAARISYAGRDLVYIPRVGDGPDSAQVCPQPVGDTYEIREIDAWMYDDCWVWNTSYRIGEFTTTGDVSRALRQALKRLGVTFYRGRTVTVYDGDVYEIQDRATGEPLFAAIPKEA